MRFLNAHRLHESGNVVGEMLRHISTVCFVRFTGAPEVERDAGEVFGILGNLEGVAGVICSKVGNENQRLTTSLLIVVDGEVVGFDLRHETLLIGRNLAAKEPAGSNIVSGSRVSCTHRTEWLLH